MFWLKKLVSFCLMPLPLGLGLIATGLVVAWAARRTKLGHRIILVGTALLILLSNRFVSRRLLRPLESRYPAIPELADGSPAPAALADCAFVCVLGGGHGEMDGLPATSLLSASALSRIVEAVRILRYLPEARLIVSGPAPMGHISHAAVLARAAQSLGVNPGRITLIQTALDTEDESKEFARLVGHERVALITSAWHMPRAAHLFRRAGINFVPCPADFAARGDGRLRWTDLGWDIESLGRSTMAVHERLGLAWLWLRGA